MIGKREGEEGPLQGGKIDEDEVEGGDDSKDHRDNRLKKGQGGVAEKREEHTAWNGKAKRSEDHTDWSEKRGRRGKRKAEGGVHLPDIEFHTDSV